MSEPLKRVGRGGAGNYVPKDTKPADLGRQSEDVDLERNASNPNAIEGASLDRSHRDGATPGSQLPEYVRTGRGGAGNMTNADDVDAAARLEASATKTAKQQQQQQQQQSQQQTDAAGTAKRPDTLNDRRVSVSLSGPSGAAPLTRGRGGAGNYAGLTDEDKERKRRDEENRAHEEAARARREIEGEVDGAIRPPGKAMLNQGRGRGEEF